MKIALLIEKFGGVGGAERQAVSLVRSLAQRGHEVRVFASEVRGQVPGVQTTALGTRHHVSFARRARDQVAGGGFDVVHSYARTVSQDILRLGGGLHAEYLARMEPVRSPLARWFSRINPKERAILDLERESLQPSATRLIQAVSNRVRDEAVRHYGVDPSRVAVLHNAVDLGTFRPELRARRDGILSTLGIPREAFVVLFVGAGFRRKGLDRAIEAVGRLPQDARAWLVVVGRGRTGRYARLARRRRARVVFAGPRPDVENFHGAADALVLPTRYDPFPNVCLEAMACGVPVIVTRVAGVSELISDGTDSFVVEDPGDPADIAARLERLFDPSFRGAMSPAARAVAERRPLDRYVDETLELYTRVIAARAAGS